MADHALQNTDEVINKELIKNWLLWGFFWILVAPTLGVIVSTKFTYPEFLGEMPELTFGRLRPIHVNGVIFGTFSTLFIGLCYYIVPKLAQVRVYKEEWGNPMMWVWNLTLIAGFVSLALGYNQGLEAAEFPLLIDIILWICLLAITVQFLVTVARRKEPGLYVSLWYLIAALVWMDINWPFGNFIIPYAIPGINNAALHGLYIHYIVGLWVTPAGYVLIYYFLPASVRNPLYSHRLSLIGFWSLALFYPFVGIHHYLFSPIADWAETISIVMSVLLIVPVWTVLQNFFGTMIGRWHGFGSNITAKFLITGALMYLLGCFQGSTEALQAVQQPTHFTDFVIAHSHLTIFGTFVLWALGGVVYVWPRVSGREGFDFRMANWGYWLITAGISAMGLILTAQGLQQGYMLIAGAEWVDSLLSMQPFWWFRTFSGISMDVGMSLLLLSLLRAPKSSVAEPSLARPPQTAPVATHSLGYAKTVAVIAGFGFITLALFVQGLLPALLPESREDKVSRVVRTRLTELKWVEYPSENYTELEQLGRNVYIREGCWYCHSQYIRPVTGEDIRWGPVSQAGEYAFDVPHLFSTRRIGPDLTRVGLKYSDHWHFAHHWNPRLVVPDSNMPAFPWLYDHVTVALEEKDGKLAFKDDPALRKIFTFKEGKQILIMPNTNGLAFARERDGVPVLNLDPLPDRPKGKSITIVLPMREAEGLVAYIQKLGTNRGQWRDLFEPQRVFITQFSVPESVEWIDRGKQIYLRRCVGCHGEKGDGNGMAATFMDPRPRDFRDGVFKFRVTPSGALPTEGDLYRTITRGVRGTAMPPWHEISEKQRLAVILFIKTLSPFWKEKSLKAAPITIPDPPPPSEEIIAQGEKLYINEGRCWNCHGGPGTKDDKPFTYPWGLGPSAPTLKDDWGFRLLATDFTQGTFKSGPDVTDIFRTMSTGLNGAAMPSFAANLTEEQRWAISYYVLSLSAYIDPLHQKKLQITEPAKTALDDPKLKTPTWRAAFDPTKAETAVAGEKSKNYLRIAE